MSLVLTISVHHTVEVGPILGSALEAIVANYESLKQQIADLTARVESEATQGDELTRENADLRSQLAGRLTPEQAEELRGDLANLAGAIDSIVDDAPAPGGGTEPTPDVDPTPTPDEEV